MNTQFIIFTVCFIGSIQGIKIETLKQCCTMGENHAAAGLECKAVTTPLSGIVKADEFRCLRSFDLCCKKHLRQVQCNFGIEDAKKGTCSNRDGERKDCCEECSMGLQIKSGESCESDLALGDAFTKCCEEAKTLATTTTTTSPDTTVLSQTTGRSSMELDRNFLENPESICDTDVCAQICEVTSDRQSYKCLCEAGFTLMGDGVSCKPIKKYKKRISRCDTDNPCDHECIDTGTEIKCKCFDGYTTTDDGQTCVDEDTQDQLDKCPSGFIYNGTLNTCDDINECAFELTCSNTQICENSVGSFVCKDVEQECPPGYYYQSEIGDCTDIDECLNDKHDCNKDSQTCLNTKGNFTCVDKAAKNGCPAGFKKNPTTNTCDDIDECKENSNICKAGETCVNENGGHSCVPAKTKKKPTTIPQWSIKPIEGANCRIGFKHNGYGCHDVDECTEDPEACDSNQDCRNTPGSYLCVCKIGFSNDPTTGACVDINECQIGTHNCNEHQRCDNNPGSFACSRMAGCGTGYTYNAGSGICEDDDECALGTHQCGSVGPDYKCRNLLGTYRCVLEKPVKATTRRPVSTTTTTTTTTTTIRPVVPARPLVPIIPVRPIVPVVPARPIYQEERIYQIPYTTARNPFKFTQPIDPFYGNNPIYTQEKKCLSGYRMSPNGQCEDINECLSNPCMPGQKCINYNGRYECSVGLICKVGYHVNEYGTDCIDINECTAGTHKCDETQICKNGIGFYTCECPLGYHLDNFSKKCVDIDECRQYRPCGFEAECTNTPGSYRCTCKQGFLQNGDKCEDVDECRATPGLCEQKCVNLWGSYRCGCSHGFHLAPDNRTCVDIDECDMFKDRRICVHKCRNIPGSYACDCPRGYKLANDRQACIDINECENHICDPTQSCVNFGGSYKCYTINCPDGYHRDPEHRSICKRSYCDSRTNTCILKPQQYTYQYFSLVSDLPIDEAIQIFQISGPKWQNTRTDFTITLIDVTCPHNIEPISERYFKKEFNGTNSMQLFLTKSPKGPQEAKFEIEMKLYSNNVISGKIIVYFIVIVSEYPF